MIVQQDFEKGRLQRLWFRRYDRYKNKPFFSGSHVGGGGGGGLYAVLYGTNKCPLSNSHTVCLGTGVGSKRALRSFSFGECRTPKMRSR